MEHPGNPIQKRPSRELIGAIGEFLAERSCRAAMRWRFMTGINIHPGTIN
jgi:hypothetical protein